MGRRAEATFGCSTCVTSTPWCPPPAGGSPPARPRPRPAFLGINPGTSRRRTSPSLPQQCAAWSAQSPFSGNRTTGGTTVSATNDSAGPMLLVSSDFVPDTESLAVRVEVVPQRPEVEIEDVPADPASGLGPNRRRIPDERPPVDAHRLFCRGCGLSHGMRFGALMRPGDGASWPDRHVIGVVPPWAVLDRDAGGCRDRRS